VLVGGERSSSGPPSLVLSWQPSKRKNDEDFGERAASGAALALRARRIRVPPPLRRARHLFRLAPAVPLAKVVSVRRARASDRETRFGKFCASVPSDVTGAWRARYAQAPREPRPRRASSRARMPRASRAPPPLAAAPSRSLSLVAVVA